MGQGTNPTTASEVQLARSVLFVPGERPDRFDKAVASGADVVVCDLEDAVAPKDKHTARRHVAGWLADRGVGAVRINAAETPWYDDDCSALKGLPGLTAVVVPKAEDPRELAALGARLGGDIPLVALVETALGVHRAFEVATAPCVARLAFGSVDFALDTGAAEDYLPLLHARSVLVIASRAGGLPRPLDGIEVALDDPEAARTSALTARALGFGGKLCIHPRQVAPVNESFTPSVVEVEQARRLLASVRDGTANRVDGQMVDLPVLERARGLLRQAELWAAPKGTS